MICLVGLTEPWEKSEAIELGGQRMGSSPSVGKQGRSMSCWLAPSSRDGQTRTDTGDHTGFPQNQGRPELCRPQAWVPSFRVAPARPQDTSSLSQCVCSGVRHLPHRDRACSAHTCRKSWQEQPGETEGPSGLQEVSAWQTTVEGDGSRAAPQGRCLGLAARTARCTLWRGYFLSVGNGAL